MGGIHTPTGVLVHQVLYSGRDSACLGWEEGGSLYLPATCLGLPPAPFHSPFWGYLLPLHSTVLSGRGLRAWEYILGWSPFWVSFREGGFHYHSF